MPPSVLATIPPEEPNFVRSLQRLFSLSMPRGVSVLSGVCRRPSQSTYWLVASELDGTADYDLLGVPRIPVGRELAAIVIASPAGRGPTQLQLLSTLAEVTGQEVLDLSGRAKGAMAHRRWDILSIDGSPGTDVLPLGMEADFVKVFQALSVPEGFRVRSNLDPIKLSKDWVWRHVRRLLLPDLWPA